MTKAKKTDSPFLKINGTEYPVALNMSTIRKWAKAHGLETVGEAEAIVTVFAKENMPFDDLDKFSSLIRHCIVDAAVRAGNKPESIKLSEEDILNYVFNGNQAEAAKVILTEYLSYFKPKAEEADLEPEGNK
jgi:hypothetical protein